MANNREPLVIISNSWCIYLEGSTLGWRRALCLLPVSHLTLGRPGVEHGGRDGHWRLLCGTEQIMAMDMSLDQIFFFLYLCIP